MEKELYIYTAANNCNNDIAVKVFSDMESAQSEMRYDYEAALDCAAEIYEDENCISSSGWHVYDGDSYYYGSIHPITFEFSLSNSEKDAICREVEHGYRLTDAENALAEFAWKGMGSDAVEAEIEQRFIISYGFSLQDACDPSSEHYALERIVERFEHFRDCNIDENSTWSMAVSEIIKPAFLPSRVIITDSESDGDYDEIADILSDRYGFCVLSFAVEVTKDHSLEVHNIEWDISE